MTIRQVSACWVFALWMISAVAADDAGTTGSHFTFRYLTDYGSPQTFRTLEFSPDSSQIAISVAGNVDFIDCASGRVTGKFKSSPFSVTYTRDGSKIYMISQYESLLLDTLTGAKLTPRFELKPGYVGLGLELQSGKLLIKRIAPGGPASQADGLSIGDELIGFSEGRNGEMYDLTGRSVKDAIERMKGTAGTYFRVRVLPRGKFSEQDARVHLLRRTEMKQAGSGNTYVKPTPTKITDNLAWCVYERKHQFRDPNTGMPLVNLETIDINNVGLYAISPDQQRFAVVSRSKGDSSINGVEIFDLVTQGRLAYVPMVKDSYYDIAFAPDNNLVLVATYDTIEVIDTDKGKLVNRLTLGYVPPKVEKKQERAPAITASVARAAADRNGFGPKNNKRAPNQLVAKIAVSKNNVVATADRRGMVKLWDLKTGSLLYELPQNPTENTVAFKFSPNGKWLSYMIAGVLHVVDVAEIKPLSSEQIEAMRTAAEEAERQRLQSQVAKNPGPSIPGLGPVAEQAMSATLEVGAKVEVRSRGQWFPATIVSDLSEGRWEIHYDNSPDDWNEIATAPRIRSREE